MNEKRTARLELRLTFEEKEKLSKWLKKEVKLLLKL